MKLNKTNDLEERVNDFAVIIVSVFDKIKTSYARNYYGSPLVHSSVSSALYYGEARSVESPKDFVVNIKNNLKIVNRCSLIFL